MFQAITGIVLALFIVGATGAGYLYSLNRVVDVPPEAKTPFIIEKGHSLSQVAFDLKVQGYIRSDLLFKLIGRFKGTENAMKSGIYEIPPGSTTLRIHDYLVQGRQKLEKVTIPEGLTVSKIAGYIAAQGIAKEDDFIKAAGNPEILSRYGISASSLEGFLYPDTYYFPKDFPPEKVVAHMVDTFFTKLEKIYPEHDTLSGEELFDRVIVASIVEREYRVPEEAPLIASVFYNRIDLNIALGSCATVEYVITEEQGKPHPKFLNYSDLEIVSDYNTYLFPGLPPGPISNPGETALRAAFFPEESDFLYFLLQDTESGRHYFSRTYTEHNRAKSLYLKGVSE